MRRFSSLSEPPRSALSQDHCEPEDVRILVGAQISPTLHAMISHPLGNLAVEDGDLWEVYPGPPLKRTRYMTAPAFSIVEKGNVTELRDKKCRYEFKTNHPVDQIWGFLLQEHFPGVHWEPGKAILQMECIPANLTSQYQRLKTAVAEANEHYVRERNRLIEEVRKIHENAANAAKTNAQRSEAVRKGFEELEI